MTRALLLLPFVVGCTTGISIREPEGELGSIHDDVVEDDDPRWDGASLRIVSPASGSFMALEENRTFTAELTDAYGEPVEDVEIRWTSSADVSWQKAGVSFDDADLDVGLHDITAEATLPNGDRLVYTAGGVLLQSKYAGTYSGLFNSNVTYDGYSMACAGTALIVVDAWGEEATGDATCVIAFNGYELEATYLFDLENDGGDLDGTVAIDIGGFYQVEFEGDGDLDGDEGLLDIAFEGDLADTMAIDGTVEAPRVSLDAGL